MQNKNLRLPATIALLLGFAVLLFICVLTALHAVGTDDALYYKLQMDAGVLPGAGISEEDLRTLDGELAAYLAGSPNQALALELESEPGQYSVLALNVNGVLQPAFGEREMTHLEDCAKLFALLRKVRQRLIPWAILLIAAGARLLADRRRIRRAAWLSPLILLIPLGAFALWACVDFDGAFTFFHRVLFTNDLWLLDPRTELLIRICPQSMFMAMGLKIALWGLAALIAVPALTAVLTTVWPKQKRKEEDSWNDNRATRRASAYRRTTFDVKGKR